MEHPVVPLCEITLPFADGEYRFRLNGPQRSELQRLCGVQVNHPQYGIMPVPVGLGAILARVLRGRYRRDDGTSFGIAEEGEWHDADLTETIRLALIGGGLDAVRAKQLVDVYVSGEGHSVMPRAKAWDLTAAILWACCQGFHPPAPKVATPSKKATPGKTKAGSTTPAT